MIYYFVYSYYHFISIYLFVFSFIHLLLFHYIANRLTVDNLISKVLSYGLSIGLRRRSAYQRLNRNVAQLPFVDREQSISSWLNHIYDRLQLRKDESQNARDINALMATICGPGK